MEFVMFVGGFCVGVTFGLFVAGLMPKGNEKED
jgi:hypothetical protein